MLRRELHPGMLVLCDEGYAAVVTEIGEIGTGIKVFVLLAGRYQRTLPEWLAPAGTHALDDKELVALAAYRLEHGHA